MQYGLTGKQSTLSDGGDSIALLGNASFFPQPRIKQQGYVTLRRSRSRFPLEAETITSPRAETPR
jgi:hypothetical protein